MSGTQEAWKTVDGFSRDLWPLFGSVFCLGEKRGLLLWWYAQDEVLGSVTCTASFMSSR